MAFYNERTGSIAIKWNEAYPDAETFEYSLLEYMDAKDVINFAPISEMYDLMRLKYDNSYTRYNNVGSLSAAIVREMKTVWPAYKRRRDLTEDIHTQEVEDVMNQMRSIRNLVNSPNTLNSNMDTEAIKNLSTTQESMVQKSNELDAMQALYSAAMKDYQSIVYKKLDPLFRQLLSSDSVWLYKQ